ncbi:hypothetical protein CDL12_10702 [Handroanthus impetiginosus]|uniref:Uncharacterized protein n=1 Tax=Handroanthus impetiginosus TaxID=429701 RepID=A0A2G9HGJ2_9LAMI|nr:hypothetical protein CDL12_10702 [Handroanthus impetiginosus]
MANATATENCLFNQSFDDFNVVEFPNVDDSLLMSLLEDSHAEEYGDDERLRFVIQSFEAEILNQESCLETYQPEDYGFSDVGFEWIDMEMDYKSPNDEISSYFINHCLSDEIGIMSELGVMSDYSRVCYGMPMEEENYCGLWQTWQ